MEFTDFSKPKAPDQTSTPVIDDASGLTIANESTENVLAREEDAMERQGTNPFGSIAAGPTAIGGGGAGPTEPEVARALRRVKRKGDVMQPNRIARPVAAPPLPPESAAIPLAQVPYVTSDLRRVAFSAVIIAIFIVVSGLIVTHLVH
jgi:hypothetical protein